MKHITKLNGELVSYTLCDLSVTDEQLMSLSHYVKLLYDLKEPLHSHDELTYYMLRGMKNYIEYKCHNVTLTEQCDVQYTHTSNVSLSMCPLHILTLFRYDNGEYKCTYNTNCDEHKHDIVIHEQLNVELTTYEDTIFTSLRNNEHLISLLFFYTLGLQDSNVIT